ncbi:MAG: transcription antitermination factor NusB [Myxococcales bacterium]|nr:transcription antitermination factor NusB [Myxococcales bacterium]MBL9109699.1 transcription antitermination factor NusB [Myxococcales bacterium]
MGARHTGREAALQMLFQVEVGNATAETAITLFWRQFEGDPEGRSYADAIVRGVTDDLSAIDDRLRKASTHWRLERMSRVDRNLLRLGAWELVARKDVPRAVILDEAVELAKAYGTEESPAFVNGVLNRVADDVGRRDEDRSR